MDKIKELRQKLKDLFAKFKGVREKAEKENREMTPEELEQRKAIQKEIDDTQALLDDAVAEKEMADKLEGGQRQIDGDDPEITIEDKPVYRGSPAAALGQQLTDVYIIGSSSVGTVKEEARKRLEENTKRALTLIEKRQGQAPSKEFKEKSMKPLYSDDARAAGTGQIQGIGSEGGFLLQSETSIDLMTHGFNNSAVLRRCQRRTLTGSESLEIVGIDETSRADGSRGGGVRVYTDAELSQIQSSRTKFERIEVKPKRLTGMYYASDMILKNAVFLGQEMRQLFMEEFAFKTQDLVMEGTGAGQALGVKNADCKIQITKETGQLADTIVSENILKMYQRFYLRAGDASVAWFTNRDCFKELFTMTYDVGTGGVLAKLFLPAQRPGETGSMLGYPVEFIEQAETLGDAGDVRLLDLSQYVVVDYGDINEASSIHFKFDYGQTAFRFMYFFDGQPRMVSAITPFKGSSSTTVSPFVELNARA